MEPQQIIIYSHGWGVKKDDHGLFTDIAAALPGYRHVLFDYNQVNEAEKTLLIPPLQEQAAALLEQVEQASKEHPGVAISVIAHSQGCIVAALARPAGIRAIFLLAPPPDIDVERRLKKYGQRPNAEMNPAGISRIPGSDGYTKIVPAEYWEGCRGLDPIVLYTALSYDNDLVLVQALDDTVVAPLPDGLDSALSIKKIAGDHGFTGEARVEVISLLRHTLEGR